MRWKLLRLFYLQFWLTAEQSSTINTAGSGLKFNRYASKLRAGAASKSMTSEEDSDRFKSDALGMMLQTQLELEINRFKIFLILLFGHL